MFLALRGVDLLDSRFGSELSMVYSVLGEKFRLLDLFDHIIINILSRLRKGLGWLPSEPTICSKYSESATNEKRRKGRLASFNFSLLKPSRLNSSTRNLAAPM